MALLAAAVLGCTPAPRESNAPITLRVGVSAGGAGIRVLVDILTTDPLVASELDGRQVPRLASRWSWDDTRTRLTLELTPHVFFHDGTALDAAAVVRSLEASVKAHEEFSFDSIQSITAPRSDTVEIQLSRPDSFLLPDLSITSIRIPGKPRVGTGPFAFVSNTDGVTELRAFHRYYRGSPRIERVVVTRFDNQRQAWAAMMRDDQDLLYEVSRDAVEFVNAETTVHSFTSPRPYYIPLIFNERNPIFRNVEVRRALNEAVDKEALIAQGLNGLGSPADGPIWPGHWARTDGKTYETNISAAEMRLDNAGYVVRPRVNAMPSRFAFTCLVWADDPRFEKLGLVLQKQFANIGVDMQLKPVSNVEFGKTAGEGKFDALLVELAGRTFSWVYKFWHSPTEARFIDTGYTAADNVLDSLRGATSDDQIRSGVSDLQNVLYKDPPAVFIAWQVQSRAVSNRFEVPQEPGHDILSSIWQWRPAPAQRMARR